MLTLAWQEKKILEETTDANGVGLGISMGGEIRNAIEGEGTGNPMGVSPLGSQELGERDGQEPQDDTRRYHLREPNRVAEGNRGKVDKCENVAKGQ